MPLHPDDVARTCLGHLQREEALLRHTLSTLQLVRQALLQHDAEWLASLQSAQEQAAFATARLRAERDRLQHEWAAFLEVTPAAVTLQRLAHLLPEPQRETLLNAGTAVQRLARQVDELNRCNAALVAYYLGFTQRFLLHITGGTQPAVRYGPHGPHGNTSRGSLLRARG